MKAKLFLKGLKDPIELEIEEAEAAQALIQDATKTPDTPFVIEGIWAGKKSEMKFVVFPKVEKESYATKIDAMDEVQAGEFELEIAEDKKKSEEVLGEGKTFWWHLFYFERKKAIRVEILSPEHLEGLKTHQIYVHDPILYRQLENRVEAYGLWKGKKEFVEKKKIEGLEKLAEQMNVN